VKVAKFVFLLLILSFFLNPIFPLLVKLNVMQKDGKFTVILFSDIHLYDNLEKSKKQFECLMNYLKDFPSNEKNSILVENFERAISFEHLFKKDFLDFFDKKSDLRNVYNLDINSRTLWSALTVKFSEIGDDKIDKDLERLNITHLTLASLYKQVLAELEIFEKEPFISLRKQNNFFANYICKIKKEIAEEFILEILNELAFLLGSSYSQDDLLSTPIVDLYKQIKFIKPKKRRCCGCEYFFDKLVNLFTNNKNPKVIREKFSDIFSHSNCFLNKLMELNALSKIYSSGNRVMVFAGADHIKELKLYLEKDDFYEVIDADPKLLSILNIY
jgi:flagellar biosynthesis regulator FlbT